jgi:hypothetical protein
MTIDNAAGAISLRVNGVSLINATGLDTASTANNSATQLQISGFNTFQGADWDDLVLLDATGGAPLNDHLPDCRIATLAPTSDVSIAAIRNTGATNFGAVDELPSNGDTDYVTFTGPGIKDLYGYANLPDTPGTIYGVQVSAVARNTSGGVQSLDLKARFGGVDSTPTTIAFNSTTYFYATQFVPSNPGTGLPWTAANFSVGIQASIETV